jgi:hypothetical protein
MRQQTCTLVSRLLRGCPPPSAHTPDSAAALLALVCVCDRGDADEVLSKRIPAAMLEDLLEQPDRPAIPAFEFYGDVFVLSQELEEAGGALVFVEQVNPDVKIWKGDDGSWYRNDGDGTFSKKWRLPPGPVGPSPEPSTTPSDDANVSIAGPRSPSTPAGMRSRSAGQKSRTSIFGQDGMDSPTPQLSAADCTMSSFPPTDDLWESAKDGFDPPFPLDSVHVMSEPGDSVTMPKVGEAYDRPSHQR